VGEFTGDQEIAEIEEIGSQGDQEFTEIENSVHREIKEIGEFLQTTPVRSRSDHGRTFRNCN
jgi:hypothetical protein